MEKGCSLQNNHASAGGAGFLGRLPGTGKMFIREKHMEHGGSTPSAILLNRIFFWPWGFAGSVCNRGPGIEPGPQQGKAQNPNPWATKELPILIFQLLDSVNAERFTQMENSAHYGHSGLTEHPTKDWPLPLPPTGFRNWQESISRRGARGIATCGQLPTWRYNEPPNTNWWTLSGFRMHSPSKSRHPGNWWKSSLWMGIGLGVGEGIKFLNLYPECPWWIHEVGPQSISIENHCYLFKAYTGRVGFRLQWLPQATSKTAEQKVQAPWN